MTGQPRPDDEARARFHNGDTLDDIPIVRLPPTPQPNKRRGLLLAVTVLATAVVGALAGVGILALVDDGSANSNGRTAQGAPTASPASPSAEKPSAEAPPSSAPPITKQAAALEQVRIIQTPPTGGDPSSSYCLVYTGSSSGAEHEAILLMNAPGYQCQDMLSYDPTGETSPLVTEAPDCKAPSRAAVLSFAETGVGRTS